MTPDVFDEKLSFAITFYDRFTQDSLLADETTVELVGLPVTPVQKWLEATYLFFGLKPGPYSVRARNGAYLQPADIAVTLPMPNPRWPAYPDATLADPNKPLDDPGQTPAYLAQRNNVTLVPGTGYPFPAGATLVRGTVRFAGNPLAGAQVGPASGGATFPTGADGQYVLPFPNVSGSSSAISLRASHPMHVDVVQSVTVQRGMTVQADFTMV